MVTVAQAGSAANRLLTNAAQRGATERYPLDTAHREMSNSGKTVDAPKDYLLKVDNPLVVPVGKKVRIITTANDVIHAWGVPSLGVKQDAIPGFVRDTWFRAERVGGAPPPSSRGPLPRKTMTSTL